MSVRLEDRIIRDLLTQFMAATTDEKKRTVVSQLGMHPVNHAVFGHEIGRLNDGGVAHAYLWGDYLETVKWIT